MDFGRANPEGPNCFNLTRAFVTAARGKFRGPSFPGENQSIVDEGKFTDFAFANRKRLAARVQGDEFIPMPFLEIVVGSARGPSVHGDIAVGAGGITQQLRGNVVGVFRE